MYLGELKSGKLITKQSRASARKSGFTPRRREGPGIWRFLEFFTVNISNKNTRAAYARAAGYFLLWCEDHGLFELSDIRPMHVAGYVKQLQWEPSTPAVKQHLACIRMFFD